ncbi:hypothetical protein [Paenibacillus sp. FSL E2-0178]|uniref:hypothetical protein n=1 Tax=Paenibacillus sp. FSL E2-0178 TaxID=2921361 RepID=UPI003158E740
MKSIGIEAKRYRELQGITVEELHEEMNKSIPTNIDAIYSFESGEYNEKLYFLKIGQFTTFFYKTILDINNKATSSLLEHIEIWRMREEILRGFIVEENQFRKLKRFITESKNLTKGINPEVYEQFVEFEEYFQDQVKRDIGVNKYAWA